MEKKHLLRPAGRLKILAVTMTAGAGLLAHASPASNTHALLAQMTLDEKTGQMVQVDSAALKNKADVKKCFLKSVLSGGGSDPADNSPATWKKFAADFQAERVTGTSILRCF